MVRYNAMKKKDLEELFPKYLEQSQNNELHIFRSKQCGCLHCGTTFPSVEVSQWSKNGSEVSALCPNCGDDTVVGDADGLEVSELRIQEMQRIFKKQISEDQKREKLIQYCDLYHQDLISKNAKNEAIYVQNLHELMVEYRVPFAALSLAQLYRDGGVSISPDVSMAEALFSNELLRLDTTALRELGHLYLAYEGEGRQKKAFECFSKAAALGSLMGSTDLAICYINGYFVEKDEEFGFQLLDSVYHEVFPRLARGGLEPTDTALIPFMLCSCSIEGVGVPQNEASATYFYLVTRALSSTISDSEIREDYLEKSNLLFSSLQRGRNPAGIEGVEFDVDTFYDSFYYDFDDTENKSLENVSYNPEEGTLSFDIVSSAPLLIVDAGNLSSGFLPITKWKMVQVELLKLDPVIREFRQIVFRGTEYIDFIYEDPIVGQVVVMSIHVPPNEVENSLEE